MRSNLKKSSTFPPTTKVYRKWSNKYSPELFRKYVEDSIKRKLSYGYSDYDRNVLEMIEKDSLKKKIINQRAKNFVAKKHGLLSLIEKSALDQSLNRDLVAGEDDTKPPAQKRKFSLEPEVLSEALKSYFATQRKPRLVKIFPPKKKIHKVEENTSSEIATSSFLDPTYSSYENPETTSGNILQSAHEDQSMDVYLEIEEQEDFLIPPDVYLPELPELQIPYKEMEHKGRFQPLYRSWSFYVNPEENEPLPPTSLFWLCTDAFLTKLKYFFGTDPNSIVLQAFSSTTDSLDLETMSHTLFYSLKEWLTFFISLRNFSVYYCSSTGLLKHLLLAIPSLKIMHLKILSKEIQYCILVDFALAIYKFAYETKFTYSVSADVINQFLNLQKELWSIVVNQNFDPRDNDFFKHLGILSHAALQTNIGYPERAFGKLQRFCNVFLRETQHGEYKYTRGFIISLYFHQLALAMERDLEIRVIHEIRYKDYILKAYEYFYDCFSKEEILFPFYGFVVREYIRGFGDFMDRNSANPCMLELYNILKERKHYSDNAACELLILLAALASSTEEHQTIDFCDEMSTAENYLINEEKLECQYYSYVLELVIDIIPLLMKAEMYDRAINLLKRTFYNFRAELRCSKRMAFISNLFVNCQYDVTQTRNDERLQYNQAIIQIWQEMWAKTVLHKLPTDAKHYLYFAGIFQADLYARIADCSDSQQLLMELQGLSFYTGDRLFCSFLRPINGYMIEVAFDVCDAVLDLNIDKDLKIPIYWAVGGSRLFLDKTFLQNHVTKKWCKLLICLVQTNT